MSQPEIRLNREQIRALANPLRLEIYTILRTDGPATAKEIARRLDKEELTLYYHLRLLASRNLLLTEQRPTATKPETLYSVRGRMVVADQDLADDETRRDVQRNFESILKASAREFRTGTEVLGNRIHDELSIGRLAVRLPADKLDEFKRRLSELSTWVDENSSAEGQRYSFTFALVPIVRPPL